MSWRTAAYRAVRPLLFAADPEAIHQLALRMLGSPIGRLLAPLAAGVRDAGATPVELNGAPIPQSRRPGGRLRQGRCRDPWLGGARLRLHRAGNGHLRPQEGNPRPRLFRLTADEALVNRMGFNNAGADAVAARIADARPHLPAGFVIGVNVGRNRDGDAEDYRVAARAVAGVADYLAINVSSPNTPGLRDLEDP